VAFDQVGHESPCAIRINAAARAMVAYAPSTAMAAPGLRSPAVQCTSRFFRKQRVPARRIALCVLVRSLSTELSAVIKTAAGPERTRGHDWHGVTLL
jgi:hypothetical protein